jgi:F-type H+-transporting ATPase subunit b
MGFRGNGGGTPLIRAATLHLEDLRRVRARRTSRVGPRFVGRRWIRRASHLASGVALSLLAAGEAAAAEGGLELIPDLQLLGTLLVIFVLLIVPVNAIIFKPIFRALDDRNDKISGTRARAERLERDAQAVLERYESAVREVREEAEAARRARLETTRGETAQTTGEARGAAEREIERARVELSAALEDARTSLRAQSQDLAREAAARVLGRAL